MPSLEGTLDPLNLHPDLAHPNQHGHFNRYSHQIFTCITLVAFQLTERRLANALITLEHSNLTPTLYRHGLIVQLPTDPS
jgi:hypothetical protein